MVIVNQEISDNHKKYLERIGLYRSFGYDLEKERDFILRQSLPISGKILEAGTGKGHFALALAKSGYSFTTFDISAQEQYFAKRNIAYFGFDKQVDFRIENGERPSFLDAHFDAVFSVNLLHHLSNPYKVVDELIRLTSWKGKLIIADFTPEGFKVMDKVHGLEGGSHEVGQVGLPEAQAYLAKKSFLIKKVSSVYQCVLVAERKIIRE